MELEETPRTLTKAVSDGIRTGKITIGRDKGRGNQKPTTVCLVCGKELFIPVASESMPDQFLCNYQGEELVEIIVDSIRLLKIIGRLNNKYMTDYNWFMDELGADVAA